MHLKNQENITEKQEEDMGGEKGAVRTLSTYKNAGDVILIIKDMSVPKTLNTTIMSRTN